MVSRGIASSTIENALSRARSVAGDKARELAAEARKSADSIGLLVRCLHYHVLRGRRDDLGQRLTPEERDRLRELEGVFRSEKEPPPINRPGYDFLRRHDPRIEVRVPVEFRTVRTPIHTGTLEDLSRGGAYIATAHPLQQGQRISIRFTHESQSSEWRISAEVMWARGGQAPGMGVRFIGVPVEVRLGPPPAGNRSVLVAA